VTIRQKLHLSVLLLVVAFGVTAGTIAYIFSAIHSETAHIAEVNQINRMVFELSLLGYEYQTHREERALWQWRGIHHRLNQGLETMVATTMLPEARSVLRHMRDNHALIGTIFDGLTAQETDAEAIRLIGQSLLLRSNVMVADAHQLADASNKAVAERTNTLVLILIGSLTPLAVVCVFVFLANRRILRALAALHEGTDAIGQGRLAFKLDVSGRDEFAALAGRMNAMTAQLRTLYQELTENMQALSRENVERRRAEQTLKRSMEQLERSNRELEDFAYISSHDLREPLRGIHNYASFLLEDYAERLDDEGQAKLYTLAQLSQRMDSLIDALLHYSRVGSLDLAMDDIDLNRILAEVLDSLDKLLHEAGIEVRVPAPLPTVRCDKVGISEVFRNLIGNAMQYNDKPHKWIEIGCIDHDQQTRHTVEGQASKASLGACQVLYVRDNGIGILQKHHEAIFRIFKRLHGRDKYGGGVGVGLTMVRRIIERHEGRIWVESSPGQGATFYFTIAPQRRDMDA
jgi:signal transduction histidine kinase